MKCGDCRFFDPEGRIDDSGRCRAERPNVLQIQVAVWQTVWPRVRAAKDWCGRFEIRPDRQCVGCRHLRLPDSLCPFSFCVRSGTWMQLDGFGVRCEHFAPHEEAKPCQAPPGSDQRCGDCYAWTRLVGQAQTVGTCGGPTDFDLRQESDPVCEAFRARGPSS